MALPDQELSVSMAEHLANLPALAKEMSVLTGFDREAMDLGGKQNGIIQFCLLASSGEVHQIAEDETGTYTLLTGQTEFTDGTALADRTMMQYHAAGETQFSYWRHGNFVEVTTAKFIQIAADYKGYIGYNAAGELDDTITDVRELIIRTPLVAYIYMNGTKGTIEWFADERHGIVLDGQAHLAMHQDPAQGFFTPQGLDIHGIENNGTEWVSMDAGVGGDEDIKMVFGAITEAPKLYMEGAANEWTYSDSDKKLGIFRGGKCCYNDVSGTPALLPIGSDRVVMIEMCSNNKIHPRAWLVGQKLHTTRSLARTFGPSDYDRIKSDGLPSQEAHPVGSVIVNSESSGTAEVGSDDEIWYDHRTADSTPREEGDND